MQYSPLVFTRLLYPSPGLTISVLAGTASSAPSCALYPARVSAPSFPVSPLWPFIHWKYIRVPCCLSAAMVTFQTSLFIMPIQPQSSHLFRWKQRPSIIYLESDIVLIVLFQIVASKHCSNFSHIIGLMCAWQPYIYTLYPLSSPNQTLTLVWTSALLLL